MDGRNPGRHESGPGIERPNNGFTNGDRRPCFCFQCFYLDRNIYERNKINIDNLLDLFTNMLGSLLITEVKHARSRNRNLFNLDPDSKENRPVKMNGYFTKAGFAATQNNSKNHPKNTNIGTRGRQGVAVGFGNDHQRPTSMNVGNNNDTNSDVTTEPIKPSRGTNIGVDPGTNTITTTGSRDHDGRGKTNNSNIKQGLNILKSTFIDTNNLVVNELSGGTNIGTDGTSTMANDPANSNNSAANNIQVDTDPANGRQKCKNSGVMSHDKIDSSSKAQTDTSSEDTDSSSSTASSFYSAGTGSGEEEIYAVSLGWRKPVPFHFPGWKPDFKPKPGTILHPLDPRGRGNAPLHQRMDPRHRPRARRDPLNIPLERSNKRSRQEMNDPRSTARAPVKAPGAERMSTNERMAVRAQARTTPTGLLKDIMAGLEKLHGSNETAAEKVKRRCTKKDTIPPRTHQLQVL